MCWIYLYFYRALKAQGFDRKDLPYIGWAQPYCAWFGIATMVFTVSCYGYATFLPGCKSTASFTWTMIDAARVGCRHIFLLLHNGIPLPDPLLWMEGRLEIKDHQA